MCLCDRVDRGVNLKLWKDAEVTNVFTEIRLKQLRTGFKRLGDCLLAGAFSRTDS